MKKVVLIQPPVQDFYDTDIRLQPIGLCSLKAAVKKFIPEIEVKVLDFHQGYGRKTIPLPRELGYLKDYYFQPDTGPFRTFDQFFHFGADFELIASEVAKEKPNFVGISSLFTPYFREILTCAAAIKQRLDVPILVGGSHVSADPVSILENDAVDFIIQGEGERPLVELLQALLNNGDLKQVANLGFKSNGQCILNERQANYALNELPIPDFSDLSLDTYLYDGRPVCMIMASRGCPHACAFCSVSKTFGRKYRPREPEDILAEMKARYLEGYRVFDFEDDNLSFDLTRFKELCRLITTEFADKDTQLLAMNGISYKSLDPEALALMKEAGFTHRNLALVSADQKILRAMGRPHSVEGFSKIATEAFRHGLKTVAYQILGLPGENLQSMIRTLTLLAQQPVLIGVSIFYLIPGSKLAASFPVQNEIDYTRARSTAMAIESDACSRDDLFTLFITARILNFLKGTSFEHDDSTLSNLLKRDYPDPRTQNGILILRKLMAERTLHGITRKGDLFPIQRFNVNLFFRILSEIKWLRQLDGSELHIVVDNEFHNIV